MATNPLQGLFDVCEEDEEEGDLKTGRQEKVQAGTAATTDYGLGFKKQSTRRKINKKAFNADDIETPSSLPYSAYNDNVRIDIFGAAADEMNPQDRVADDSIRSGTSLTPFVSSQLDHKTSAETPTPSKNWSTKNALKVSARKMK